MEAIDLLILILIFQVKHFVADFLLQGKYMLGKFKVKGWELPLAAHSLVHMVMTFTIILHYLPIKYALGLAIIDMGIHFLVDRAKVVLSRDYDKDVDKEFWWWLGADQMAHHVTHYAIAFSVITIASTI
ncbi:membrane protein [Vibrio phage D148]